MAGLANYRLVELRGIREGGERGEVELQLATEAVDPLFTNSRMIAIVSIESDNRKGWGGLPS